MRATGRSESDLELMLDIIKTDTQREEYALVIDNYLEILILPQVAKETLDRQKEKLT